MVSGSSRASNPVKRENQTGVELYRDFKFQLKFRKAPRRISCTGDRTDAVGSAGAPESLTQFQVSSSEVSRVESPTLNLGPIS